MKKRNVTTQVICILAILIAIATPAFAKKGKKKDKSEKQYSPVVMELKALYDTDKNFRNIIDNALLSAIPTPDGWSPTPEELAKYPDDSSELFVWPEKNFEDLMDFFQAWSTFVPNPTNGMEYYELLYGLCYYNVNALKFVATEPGLSWTKKFVDARGDFMDSTASIDPTIMEQWKEALGPAWNDFIPPHDTTEGFEGYTTFNEFFTRNVKPEARPIFQPENDNILSAPADGLVNVINQNLNTESRIHTKYNEYLNVDQLLAGSEHASKFIGGTATASVLLPNDYHHYHSPAAGTIVETKAVDYVGGVYFGMDGQFFTFSNNGNIGGYQSNYGIFGVYHRGYYIIKTKHHGYIAMIPVGLDDISSINFEPKFEPGRIPSSGVQVKKGEKIGHFAYGGSTVILLFEPGVFDGIKLQQGVQFGELNPLNAE
ncbi:phosphatidylserine decarboxylase [Aureibacter tunicatorum]|uniref:Phosphatidylserine decarboxylase n=1 Tax=Aureibacter tunicatorum TaxID=866807 RepID=A0AAE4BPF4_9BACT|nr:phosphatidylserine decarboxylase [Aureibacter tunicatorum]MDR6237924.1 phosphatidylserine decarboxylase [Aureibacter tunicatorum]BDD02957.1 hypothetical protein AUTU_04400 [Aureibacter tunicatorum]